MNNKLPSYQGNDKLLFGMIFGVLAFWLFAQTTLNINVDMARDLGMDQSAMNIAVSITSLFSGIFIVVVGGLDTVNVEYKNKDGVIVRLEASAILIATGRKPNVEGLNLAAAGIQTNTKGYVAVDEFLKTNVTNIWAIGDINGGPQFTYISLDDFRIIRDQLSGGSYTSVAKRKLVAFSVFITPPLAHIGLREKEAVEKGYAIKVAKLPAAAIPRALILSNTDGFLKTIVNADTNKILGCTLFCVDANEMINTVQTAMNAELDYSVVRDAIYTHPSMTEALNDLFSNLR